MVEIIWTEPALAELDAIADYIALDKPSAASRFVKRAFSSVERLALFPESGSRVPELPKTVYRRLVAAPCRIFYRRKEKRLFIVFVMRGERQFKEEYLREPGE